jgi:hypothetical protein
MALNRKQISNVYRPQGPKAISLGNAWTSGGKVIIPGAQVDLSVPLEGFRLVFKMRDVIGTAAMTTANALGYLNMIQRIFIYGKNSRVSGNATLWDIDLPSAVLIQATIQRKPMQYNGINPATGGAALGSEFPDTGFSSPLGTSGTQGIFLSGATGTYDIRIVVDLPAYPFDVSPFMRGGYFLRSQEWADSIQMRIEFPTITNGATHALGTDAGTTTHTFSGFGGGGSPTLDVYGLPAIMGPDLDAVHVPGFLSRITIPVTTQLQSAGSLNTRLLTLEKQNSKRIWAIVGVSTVNPFFSTFSDTNLTTLAMNIGSNKVIRENDDVFSHKQDQVRRYGTYPIQGVTLLDFINASLGNSDAHYDAGQAGEGSTLELRGTVVGVANALGNFIQEIEQYKPDGALYSA